MYNIVLPKNQILWLTQTENDIPIYIVTSNHNRETYYLYSVDKNNKLTKIKSSSTPQFKELGY